jgi:hypothetical protein
MLTASYNRAFSGREPRYNESLAEAARLVLERIGSSDALYHTAEHTALVTLVGQDILRGERSRREVTEDDWLHFTLARLLTCDASAGVGAVHPEAMLVILTTAEEVGICSAPRRWRPFNSSCPTPMRLSGLWRPARVRTHIPPRLPDG